MHDFVSLGGFFLLLAGDGGCNCCCHDYCRANIQKPILFHEIPPSERNDSELAKHTPPGTAAQDAGERSGVFFGSHISRSFAASYNLRFGPTACAPSTSSGQAVGCVLSPPFDFAQGRL